MPSLSINIKTEDKKLRYIGNGKTEKRKQRLLIVGICILQKVQMIRDLVVWIVGVMREINRA